MTDKEVPGNPTRSYRSREPLRVVGEVTDWTRLTPRGARGLARPAGRDPRGRARGDHQLMPHPRPVARRIHELIEPISMVNFASPEPNDEMVALGFDNYWDGYFAGRSAPLGLVPAEVVPRRSTTSRRGGRPSRPARLGRRHPEAAHSARERGCVAALRRILGDLVGSPGLARAAELSRSPRPAPRPRAGHVRRPPPLPVPEGARGAGCGTRPTCCASTAGAHIVALVSEGSGDRVPRPQRALDMGIHPRSPSAGSTTSRGPPRRGDGRPASSRPPSTPRAASPTPGGRPRPGSRHRPTRSPRRRTSGWSRPRSRSWSGARARVVQARRRGLGLGGRRRDSVVGPSRKCRHGEKSSKVVVESRGRRST